MKAVFVFSGQGAQTVGMGRDLFENCTAAANVFKKADGALDWPVTEICFDGPEDRLTESRYCQPAIYTMSAACLAAFQNKYPNVQPVGCAGLSLGEFAALSAAGGFEFTDGLKLVAKRGELMDQACKETEGAMATILGGEPEIISETCKECEIDTANFNCPGQIVISGSKEGVNNAMQTLKDKGLRKIIPLKVAGAYHSRLMKGAGEKFGEILKDVDIKAPSVPFAQNFTGGVVSNPDDIRKNLVSQVAGSVRWEECMRTFIAQGVDTFIEFGPGNVLTGLLKRTDKSIKGYNINSIDSVEKFAEFSQ
jgi:[acyl-carrier-protein] S-malonyltransferase